MQQRQNDGPCIGYKFCTTSYGITIVQFFEIWYQKRNGWPFPMRYQNMKFFGPSFILWSGPTVCENGKVRKIVHSAPRPDILSSWRQLLILQIPCHVHWPRSYCRSRARARLPYTENPVSWTGPTCTRVIRARRAYIQGALSRRGGATPWVRLTPRVGGVSWSRVSQRAPRSPVAVWGLGLLLYGDWVDYGNVSDNTYSQGGQELNASAGVC